MQKSINLILLFSILFLLALYSKHARAQMPGDNLFFAPIVHVVNITFSQPDYWNLLTTNYDSSIDKDTGIYIVSKITIDSLTFDSVGIRLKGNSSYKHPGFKKPFKISFNQYISNQNFDNLKQINFNNGYLDPSMMREKLMLDFLNQKEIPAPRCAYAEVNFNGAYVGLYKIVEEVDKIFLKSHFGNKKGNLYKGDPSGTLEFKGEAKWNYYEDYNLKTNETINDWTDLIKFINQINNSAQADFKNITDGVFNSSPFIKAWAANNLFVNLDSYFNFPHNYYLYHNQSTQKFEWITWDVSVSFGVFPLYSEKRASNLEVLFIPNRRQKHPLTVKMLETEDYKNEYLNAFCNFLYNDFKEEILFPKIDSLYKILHPFIERELPSNQMYSLNDFEQNISEGTIKKWWYQAPGLKSFITARRNFVINRLCEMKWSCEKGQNIKESRNEILTIYPNPTAGDLKVELKILEPESRKVDYQITNTLGEIVYRESSIAIGNGYQITLPGVLFDPGIYILSAISGCESYNQKIVVIK